MSIAKRFAELALVRFQKKEPETPEYTVACERIVAQMSEGLEDKTVEELIREAIDSDYQRSLRDD